nr:MAG TPA: hypothetical protein [Caudoviricetes sp.]
MVNYPTYNTMPTATQPYGYAFNPYSMQQPPTTMQPQINTNKTFVSGIEDVRMRPLPPNSEYIFLDNEKSLLYQKKVDSKGQFEVKTYEITEYKDDTAPIAQPQVDLSGYVPRSEFEQLQSEIRALNDKITRSIAANGTGTTATTRPATEATAANGSI